MNEHVRNWIFSTVSQHQLRHTEAYSWAEMGLSGRGNSPAAITHSRTSAYSKFCPSYWILWFLLGRYAVPRDLFSLNWSFTRWLLGLHRLIKKAGRASSPLKQEHSKEEDYMAARGQEGADVKNVGPYFTGSVPEICLNSHLLSWSVKFSPHCQVKQIRIRKESFLEWMVLLIQHAASMGNTAVN